jgi:hypothetical protein
MISLNVSDGGSIALAKSILGDYPKALHRALARSIGDASRAARAEINRQLLSRYDISRANLKEAFTVRTITPKQEGAIDRGGLLITGKRIPVMKFNVIPDSPPPQAGIPIAQRQILSTVVVKGQALVGRPNRFVPKMKSGHTGVFHRTGKDKQIQEEFRVSVPEMIAGKEIRPKILDRTSEVFQKRILHHVERELEESRKKKKE